MPLEAPVITAVRIAPTLAPRLCALSSSRPRSAEISVSSRLDAPPAKVWDRITTPEGINDEMRPYLRMTLPPGVDGLDLESIELGKPIGRSWILLFGLLPFDYDDVLLIRLEPDRSFLERSRMLSQRSWEHERTLEPSGGGCLITDRVRWEPRLGIPGRPLRPVIAWFFGHRHRRLRRHFGGVPS
jgi:ligand-binding SRPBCC domain-containing protein